MAGNSLIQVQTAAATAARDRFADLMEAVAARQDRAAFGEIFAYYGPRVKGYLLRLGADDSLAEEIAQEVMVTVWRKAALFDREQASVATWIFRIARNRRIDAARRAKKPELAADDPDLAPPPETQPDDALTAQEMEARVRSALAELPEDQVKLVRASFYEGLSHREIADALGLPLGTVKSRIRLAFGRLRARLAGEIS